MGHFESIGIVIGATGFWQLIVFLVRYGIDRRLKLEQARKEKAEATNLNVKTESQIIGNWIQWANTLENKLKILTDSEKTKDEKLASLTRENCELKKKVRHLEIQLQAFNDKVEGLHRENVALKQKLSTHISNKDHENYE